MIPAVARFVEALRREGIAISPAEVIDAARAIEAVGLERRERFRAALSATLAKGARARAAFDRTFDRFFAPPARGSGGAEAKGSRAPGSGEQRSESGEGRGRKPAKEPSKPAQSTRDPRGPRGAERKSEAARSARRQVEEVRRGAPRGASRLRSVRTRSVAAAPHDRLHVDLSKPLPTEEERRLAREIPRLVQELRLRTSRRQRRSKRGRIWTRRIFRENLSRGGTPFVLPYRAPRPRHVSVVVLVDVSHSVSRAAGYFLSMALEFLRPGRRARVIAFVDRPVDATDAIARWGRGTRRPVPSGPRRRRGRRPAEGILRGAESFADWIESLPGLDPSAASDYGRTFHTLLTSRHRPSGRDTVLVILGDARNNRFDPLAWAFEEIARRAQAVLWLVPEPEPLWGTGDSALGSYLPAVDVVIEATDLSGLSRGLGELLRRM